MLTGRFVQLDLFGEVEAAEAEAQRRRTDYLAAASAWRAQFERADWVAPYDTAGGLRKGESEPGWRCPDPRCGQVEPNGYLLSLGHGFDPDVPGRQTWNGRCRKVHLHPAPPCPECVHVLPLGRAYQLAPDKIDNPAQRQPTGGPA